MQGTGTVSDPYLISTPQDLQGMTTGVQNIYYELTQDLDMTGVNFTPIGVSNGFRGNLDGKGYKIKNLTMTYSETNYGGIFAQFFYGLIQNLGIENPIINLNNPNASRLSGCLFGYGYLGTVKNCYVNGGSITGQDNTGGMAGSTIECTFENCFTSTDVILNTTSYGGGFVGGADSSTKLTNCYSTGNVKYLQTSLWNGYSGFCGFVRNETTIFTNCFWNKETSGQSNIAKMGNPQTTNVTGLSGKTSAEMKGNQSTYTGFDFTNTWLIQSDYPLLQVFGIPELPPQLITINVMSTMNSIGSIVSRKAKTVKELTSYVNTILSDSKRSAKVFKNVEGYSSPFDSNAIQSHRTVRSSRQDVTSFMSPIYSYANRESKTVKHLLATVNPLWGSVSVFIPVNTKGAYAYCEVIQNPSRVSEVGSRSYSEYIQNPSNVEVI